MEPLTNQLASVSMAAHSSPSPAFQTYSQILERIGRQPQHYRQLTDVQIEVTVILRGSYDNVLNLREVFDASQLATAQSLTSTLLGAFKNLALEKTGVDIIRAPSVFVGRETVARDYGFVCAKKSLKLFWSWFERNAMRGGEDMLRMKLEFKCFDGESGVWSEDMVMKKLAPSAFR